MLNKTCSKCNELLPLNCFGKNSQNKTDGLRPDCKPCVRARHRRYYTSNKADRKQYVFDNRSQINAAARDWRARNKDKVSEQNSKQYKKNFNKYREYQRKYRADNKVLLAEYHSQYHQTHRREHRAKNAKRRARQLNATLPGFDEELKLVYKNCPEGLVVDHIVPLQGLLVSGLHVPWNLQYLTPEANLRKGNKHDDSRE